MALTYTRTPWPGYFAAQEAAGTPLDEAMLNAFFDDITSKLDHDVKTADLAADAALRPEQFAHKLGVSVVTIEGVNTSIPSGTNDPAVQLGGLIRLHRTTRLIGVAIGGRGGTPPLEGGRSGIVAEAAGGYAASSNYVVGDVLTLTTGGTGATVEVTQIGSGGGIIDVKVLTGGQDYGQGQSAFTGGSGSGGEIFISKVVATDSEYRRVDVRLSPTDPGEDPDQDGVSILVPDIDSEGDEITGIDCRDDIVRESTRVLAVTIGYAGDRLFWVAKRTGSSVQFGEVDVAVMTLTDFVS